MRHNLKSLASMLVATVLMVNLIMIGMLAYTLEASYKRKIEEVRTNVANLALMMDQSVTGVAREVSLVVRETQQFLESRLRAADALSAAEVNALLAVREGWLGNIADLQITDSRGQVRFNAPEDLQAGFAQCGGSA